MDNLPKTRQERKGGKKDKEKPVYSAKHVRQQEALIAKREKTDISTSKTPVRSSNPSLFKK